MGKPLQIRDVPDDVLDSIKRKAANEGLSLSSYALKALTRDAQLPTISDVLRMPRENVDLTAPDFAEILQSERPA